MKVERSGFEPLIRFLWSEGKQVAGFFLKWER